MGKNISKTIAMYLPQFHEIPENNLWWGKGFTEWMSVRKGKPLYSGHKQPKTPLDKNYYDLMNKEVMDFQCKIAKNYNIYGFCFYHYWFDGGKKILEKPAENFLKWKDIEMPFCFCWANQTWARTWSNVKEANAWSDLFEKKGDGLSDGILLSQKYGRETLWKKHFEYLLPFFSDSRYIRIDGKPLLLIYKTDDIYSLSQMLKYWNVQAHAYGFDGIYIIGENCTNGRNIDGIMQHQPGTAVVENCKNVYVRNGVRIHEYKDIWESILNSPSDPVKKTYYMGFTDFDDTPRRGAKGTVIEHSSPELFGQYFQKLKEKSEQTGSEYIFLNAWNEWGEGMYMEPDEEQGYGFLEAHKQALCNKYKYDVELENKDGKEQDTAKKEKSLSGRPSKYSLLDQWMCLRDEGKKADKYLMENDFWKVAVYGYGDLGKHLVNELGLSSIEVCYVIDIRENLDCRLPIKRPDDQLEQVDAIIVTPYLEYEKIADFLEEKVKCPLISIEELIWESK